MSVELVETRQWWCHTGEIVTLRADLPLTMYDGLNHRISVPAGGVMAQMLTGCGKRACPATLSGVHAGYRLREVPGRGPIDCPRCLEIPERLVASGIGPCVDNEGDEHDWDRIDSHTIICGTCRHHVDQKELPELYADMVLAYDITEPWPERPAVEPYSSGPATIWWEEI